MRQTVIEAPRRAILDMLRAEYHKDFEFPHVTELIYCLTQAYWERTQPLLPTNREIMFFATGHGMQKLIMPGREVVGECEGIHWSSDQMSLVVTDEDLVHTIIGELKCTRMSGSKFKSYEGEISPSHSELPQGWLKQIMAYCYANNTNTAHLVAFLLMGDYKPPFPDIRVARLEFTEDELAENWDWLQNRYRLLDLALDIKRPPVPTKWCESWECPLMLKSATCRYRLLCEAELYRKEG